MRRLPRLADLGLAVPAAGCGGGGGSGAAGAGRGPEAQVREYLAAFARGNGKAPKVTVSADGDRATAKITSRRPDYQSQVLLRKEGGAWRIGLPPASLERYKSPPGIPSG